MLESEQSVRECAGIVGLYDADEESMSQPLGPSHTHSWVWVQTFPVAGWLT